MTKPRLWEKLHLSQWGRVKAIADHLGFKVQRATEGLLKGSDSRSVRNLAGVGNYHPYPDQQSLKGPILIIGISEPKPLEFARPYVADGSVYGRSVPSAYARAPTQGQPIVATFTRSNAISSSDAGVSIVDRR